MIVKIFVKVSRIHL